MGRCTEQPGSNVPEPAATTKPQLNVTQNYEELSDSDPPDPPLPPGHYRKQHSKLKNAWYYVEPSANSGEGRASWTDPRRSGRGSPPNDFAAVWNTISAGQAVDVANTMAAVKLIPGCSDDGVVRNVSAKLNAYCELQSRIGELGNTVEPAAQAANTTLLKFAAMAVGHEVANGNRTQEHGTKWSPYKTKPKRHTGAAGTAKVTKANSRQTGDEVEVVFYGFSPMTSGDTKLMIYSNEFGDAEAPRVRMSPVHGLSPASAIVSGSIRIPGSSYKPDKSYCLALVSGDAWVREKGTTDCVLSLRTFQAAGNRPKVNVWCTGPHPTFPFSELDPALSSQVRVHTHHSEAAECIMNEVEQGVIAGKTTLTDSLVLFEMANASLNSALCNHQCYLAKLASLAAQIEANGPAVTTTFLVTLAPLVGASQNDQQAASLTIADNLLELSEQVFAGHANDLLTNPKNADVVYQAIEAVAALLMQTNNIQTFRCFALLNHIANLANLNKRGSACQQFANAAKKGPQPPKLQTEAFNNEFIHIDSRQMLTHDLKAAPGPYPLAEMFIRAVPSYNSMKQVLEGMVSKAQQGEMWSVPMPQVEQAICNMLEALPSLKAFWENEHALQEIIQILAPITEPDSVIENGIKDLLANYVKQVSTRQEVKHMQSQVQAACNGEFAGVSPLGSDKLCLALLKNRNLEQFLELGDMLALLDELYKSANNWSAQKSHKNALFDYLQRKLMSKRLVQVFQEGNRLSATAWLTAPALSVCQSKLQSADKAEALELVVETDMPLSTLKDPLRQLLVKHLENMVAKRCQQGNLADALQIAAFTIEAKVNLDLGLSLLDQFSRTTFGFLEGADAYTELLTGGQQLLNIAKEWSEFKMKTSDIKASSYTAKLVARIKHHLEKMLSQLMDSAITMDGMQLFVGHRKALQSLFVLHNCQGYNKENITGMFDEWTDLSKSKRDMLEQVTKFLERHCKSLTWHNSLTSFVRESHDLRKNKWKTSTMEQVKQSPAMTFVASHIVDLSKLAKILKSEILLLGVCDRARRAHTRNDSSPLSESTLFSSLIVNIFDEWDQIAPALVHQDAPVATVRKWLQSQIIGLKYVADNKGLKDELEAVTRTIEPDEAAAQKMSSDLVKAFDSMLFVNQQQDFMQSFVELVDQLKRNRKFKDDDNKFKDMKELCDELRRNANTITLKTIGAQRETLDKMSQVFKQMDSGNGSGQNREILKVLNEVQRKDQIIQFLESMDAANQHKFAFYVDGQSFQSSEQVVQGNRRIYSEQQMEAFTSSQQLRPLIINVLCPPDPGHRSMDGVITAVLQAVRTVAEDDAGSFITKLRQVKTILTVTSNMIGGERTDPTKLDAEFLLALVENGLWRCVNPDRHAGAVSQSMLEQKCVSIIHASGGKFKTPEGADVNEITFQQASDLSDRILLIESSILKEVGVIEHADTFQKMVSRVSNLNHALVQLHMSGHMIEGATADGSYKKLLPLSQKAAQTYTAESVNYRSAEQLSKDAAQQSKQLEKWTNGVARRRNQQPALNYFTVLQLMQLIKDCHNNAADQVQRAVEFLGVPPGQGKCQSTEMAKALIYNMQPTKQQSKQQPKTLSRTMTTTTKGLIEEGAWAEGLYLLTQLGNNLEGVLNNVNSGQGTRIRAVPRAAQILGNSLREMFVPGEPHVVACERSCDVLPMTLTVFAHFNRLPEPHEVIICTETTRSEDVELIVERCCNNLKDDKRLYAIVQPEQLTVSRQMQLVALIKGKQRYNKLGRLVIIAASQGNNASNLADAFSKYSRPVPLPGDDELKELLAEVFGSGLTAQGSQHVKVYKSSVAGTGKSYRIERVLEQARLERTAIPVFHNTTQAKLMDKYDSFSHQRNSALHIMLSPTCQASTDSLMFAVIVLGDLLDSDGRHYDPSAAQFPTLIEFPTLGTDLEKEGYSQALRFVDLLPDEMIVMDAELLVTTSSEVQMACKWLNALRSEKTGNPRPLSNPSDAIKDKASASYGRFTAHTPDVMSQADCLDVLREFCPPISTHAGAGLIMDESMILLTYWIRCMVVNGLKVFDNEKMSTNVTNRSLTDKTGKADITMNIIERIVEMSKSITSRAISTKSLLADQVLSLGMDPNSKQQTLALMDSWQSRGLFIPVFSCPNPNHDYGNMVINFKHEFASICLGPASLERDLRDYWQGIPAKLLWQKFVDYTGEVVSAKDGRVTHDDRAKNSDIPMQEAGYMLLKDVTGTPYPGGKDLFHDGRNGEVGKPRERYACHADVTSVESRKQTMSTFTLTIDNIMKMLAVYFRTKAGMPVVIMGETGCGKTYSIKYLATFLDLPFHKMDVHGGLTEQDIVDFMQKANGPIDNANQGVTTAAFVRKNAKNIYEEQCRAEDVWVFFDEVNTCDSVGLFKEMVCDHSMRGIPLPDNLKVLAALNPYRLKPQAMDGRTKVGIEHKNTEAGPTDAYGMALRDLVYVVHPIPRTVLEYVWDYGTLKNVEEERYMRSMLRQQLENSSSTAGPRLKKEFPNSFDSCLRMFSGLMQKAHDFLRRANGGEVSVVSLRDVSRCVRLFEWFYEFVVKLDKIITRKVEMMGDDGAAGEDESEDRRYTLREGRPRAPVRLAMEAITLSLAHCYYFRLQDNDEMRKLGVSRTDFRVMVEEAVGQTPDRTWRYHTENAFEENIQEKMDWIVEAMTPLPPGIAPNVALRENMFMMIVCVLNKFPLIVVGNPGTSKTLAMTMIRDKLNSSTKAPDFDEMGFAAIQTFGYQCSRHSTANEIERCFDDAIEAEKNMKNVISVVFLDEVGLAEESPALPLKVLHKLLEKPQVAFVGLSNWDLDPAKMNRAIYLVRPETRSDDLTVTAKAIIRGTNGKLLNMMSGLADAYLAITAECNHGRLTKYKDFIGLRDFYTFVKLLDRSMQENQQQLTASAFNEAILRSFGGMQREDMLGLVCQTFYLQCKETLDDLVFGKAESPEQRMLMEAPPLELIQRNLEDLPDGEMPGGRHLMILSENDSGLGILTEAGHLNDTEFICGSAFPDDNSRDNVYRNINRVKECMKTGKNIVLLNLEGIYESLYDMLNQQYTKFLGKTFCRLAVGSTSRLCEVNENFRCIMVVNSDVAYNTLDAPLLNRFEKQVLSRYDLLTPASRAIQEDLLVWCVRFLTKNGKLLPNDRATCHKLAHSAFPGVGPETLSSLVYMLQQQGLTGDSLMNAAKDKLLWIATPEAVMKVGETKLSARYSEYAGEYFTNQRHESLGALLSQQCSAKPDETIKLFVSTFSGATEDHSELNEKGLIDCDMKACVLMIDTMDSVKTVTLAIEAFFDPQSTEQVLVLQSDLQDALSLQRYNHTRYIVDDEEKKFLKETPGGVKHIVFVAHLHKDDNLEAAVQPLPLSFNEQWHCVTIDSLMPCSPPLEHLREADAARIFSSNSELNIEEVLSKGLRHCMAYLVYPGNIRPDPKSQLQMLETLMANPTFMAITKAQVLKMINEESLAVGWQLTLPQSEVAAARTFTRALAVRLERLVLKSFTQYMAIVDCNRNLNILCSEGAAGEDSGQGCEFEDLWYRLLGDTNFCEKTLQFPNVSAQLGEVVVSVCDKSGDIAFISAFPFSKFIAPAVQGLLELKHEYMAGTDGAWAGLAADYIDSLPIGKLVGKLTHQQTLCYLRDLAQLKLTGLPQCAHVVPSFRSTIEALAVTCAMDKTHAPWNNCFNHVAEAHLALMGAKNLLEPVLTIQSQLLQLDVPTRRSVEVFKNCTVGRLPDGIGNSGLNTIKVVCAFFKAVEQSVIALIPVEAARRPWEKAMPTQSQAPHMIQCYRTITLITGPMTELLSAVAAVDEVAHVELNQSWNKLILLKDLLIHLLLPHDQKAGEAIKMLAQLQGNFAETADMLSLVHYLGNLDVVKKGFSESIWNFVAHYICKFCFMGDKMPSEEVQAMVLHILSHLDKPIEAADAGASSNMKELVTSVMQIAQKGGNQHIQFATGDLMEMMRLLIGKSTLLEGDFVTNKIGTRIDLFVDVFGHNDHKYAVLVSQALEDRFENALDYEDLRYPDSVNLENKLIDYADKAKNALEIDCGSAAFEMFSMLQGIAYARIVLGQGAFYVPGGDRAGRRLATDVLSKVTMLMNSEGYLEAYKRPHQQFFMKHMQYLYGLQPSMLKLIDPDLKMDHPGIECGELALQDILSSNDPHVPSADPFYHMLGASEYALACQGMKNVLLSGEVDTMKNCFNNCRDSKQKDVLLVMAAFNEGYLSRTNTQNYGGLAANSRRVSDFGNQNCSAQSTQFAVQLCKNEIAHDLLQFKPDRNVDEVLMIRPLIHLAAKLFSSPEMQSSVWARLMLDPESLENQHLPSMPEDEWNEVLKSMNENVGVYECPNGHKYTIGNCTRPSQSAKCPECKAPIGGGSHTLSSGNKLVGFNKQHGMKIGSYAYHTADGGDLDTSNIEVLGSTGADDAPVGYGEGFKPDAGHMGDTYRGLRPTTFRILRFMVHGLLMLGIGIGNRDSVSKLMGTRGGKATGKSIPDDNFAQRLQEDFDMLKRLLNASSEDVSLRLHMMIERLTCRSTGLGLAKARNMFEHEFEAAVVKPVLDDSNCGKKIEQMKEACESGKEMMQLGNELDELVAITGWSGDKRNEQKPSLYRFRRPVSSDMFWARFEVLPDRSVHQNEEDKQRYGELKLLQAEQENIPLAAHLHGFVHMQALVVAKYSGANSLEKHKISESNDKRMTVQDAIDELQSPEAQKEWIAAFAAYRAAWNALCSGVTQFGCEEITIEPLNEASETPLQACMITCVKAETMSKYAELLVQDCVNKHNNIVSALQQGMLDGRDAIGLEAIPFDSVQPSDMLQFNELAWTAELKRTAKQSLEFGKGTDIKFSFGALCSWLREELLGSKTQVTAMFRMFKFAGEEAFGSTGPIGGIDQEPLENELAAAMFKEMPELPQMTQCLNILKQCRGFLQMMQLDGNQTLSRFAEQTVMLGGDEMSQLGDPSGVIRTAVMLSNMRDVEYRLTERLRPDVLEELNEMYQKKPDKETCDKLLKLLRTFKTESLTYLIDTFVAVMRAQFALLEEHEQYGPGGGTDKCLWKLMLMCEVPASHPQFSEYIYMCEDEEISQIYPIMDGGECVVPMSVKHMGSALRMIKSVHNSQTNPNEEEITSANFAEASVDGKASFWENLSL